MFFNYIVYKGAISVENEILLLVQIMQDQVFKRVIGSICYLKSILRKRRILSTYYYKKLKLNFE